MKTPQSPPPFNLADADLIGRAARLAQRLNCETMPYLHWDQLRRRPIPLPDCSPEDWWAAIKLHRVVARSSIPLRPKKGGSCGFVNGAAVQQAVHEVDMMAGGQLTLPNQLATRESKDRYLVRSLVEEAIHSSQLEGATTTRLVAKRMLRDGRQPRDRGEQMILNNYRTMTQLAEWRTHTLSPELVLEIHRNVTDSTFEAGGMSGRLRRPDERIEVGDDFGEVFHIPPPASELEERMVEMCRFANGQTPSMFLHPLLRAIILHYWLAYDHPFVDGNGRTARALFYWSMLRSGYWIFEFISISTRLVRAPAQYGKAFLYTQTDDDDLTYFILHQLGVVKGALEDLYSYLDRTAERIAGTERLLTGYTLNHRQQALAAHALRHPGHEYTIEGHQNSHRVVYQTARTDLLDMVSLGLLKQRKVGKRLVFEATGVLSSHRGA